MRNGPVRLVPIHMLPIGQRHLFERNDGVVSRAVDQNIDASCPGSDFIRNVLAVAFLGYVAFN